MEREILFRGKRADNGEWVYGDLTGGDTIHIGHSWRDSASDNEWWGVEVIPETLGQFTGLTDKNGVKIFEGDVISAPHFDPLFVGYEKRGASFAGVKKIADLEVSRCYWFGNDIIINDGWEIIGNIHENSNLIQ